MPVIQHAGIFQELWAEGRFWLSGTIQIVFDTPRTKKERKKEQQ